MAILVILDKHTREMNNARPDRYITNAQQEYEMDYRICINIMCKVIIV
jgi:hypothetical protein